MTDDQRVEDWNVVEWHGRMRVNCAGERSRSTRVAGRQSKSAMTGQGAAPEVPETHPASRLYRVFTGLFVFGPPALLVTAFRRRWFLATRANRRIFGVFYIL